MMWANFFQAGGWGMYPTSVFGFLLVASGLLLVLRPERRFVALVVSLGVLTLGSGVLSCSVGVANTLHYITHVAPGEQFKVLAIGCAESLNNVVLALLLGVLTALLAAAAALRASRIRAAAGPTA